MNPTISLVCFGVLAVAMIASLIWVARDARRRGRSPVRITFWCAILWPLGFLIWRGLRPPPMSAD